MNETTKNITVKDTIIHITQHNKEDYISLTDMLKYKESGGLIFKWLSNKNTIEFLGVWEKIYNPNFNYTEFGAIMQEAGVNELTNENAQKSNSAEALLEPANLGESVKHMRF